MGRTSPFLMAIRLAFPAGTIGILSSIRDEQTTRAWFGFPELALGGYPIARKAAGGYTGLQQRGSIWSAKFESDLRLGRSFFMGIIGELGVSIRSDRYWLTIGRD